MNDDILKFTFFADFTQTATGILPIFVIDPFLMRYPVRLKDFRVVYITQVVGSRALQRDCFGAISSLPGQNPSLDFFPNTPSVALPVGGTYGTSTQIEYCYSSSFSDPIEYKGTYQNFRVNVEPLTGALVANLGDIISVRVELVFYASNLPGMVKGNPRVFVPKNPQGTGDSRPQMKGAFGKFEIE